MLYSTCELHATQASSVHAMILVGSSTALLLASPRRLGSASGRTWSPDCTKLPTVANVRLRRRPCIEVNLVAHVKDDKSIPEERESDAFDRPRVRAQVATLLETEGLEVRLEHVMELLAPIQALAAHLGTVEARLWE